MNFEVKVENDTSNYHLPVCFIHTLSKPFNPMNKLIPTLLVSNQKLIVEETRQLKPLETNKAMRNILKTGDEIVEKVNKRHKIK